jgi:hypothetical protein
MFVRTYQACPTGVQFPSPGGYDNMHIDFMFGVVLANECKNASLKGSREAMPLEHNIDNDFALTPTQIED